MRAMDIIAEMPGSLNGQWRRQIDDRDTSENMTTGLPATKSSPFIWRIWYRTLVGNAMTSNRIL